ncbi:hypothetical protein IGM_00277 [Bacillus cereus HuB4-4]|uniref:Uncharacterized protein n=1 Tax=Bacillus cereus HuB4-4 TaxID=1053211 RepID=A0A9W5QZV1_BACCE|nr:hypothetical protein [Bacillus cereus]EOP99241.1 hypothetical protein IGM_00277 [Bacillus cereus HuB4-4]
MDESKKSSQVAGTTNEDKKIKGIAIELSTRDIQPASAKRNWLKKLLKNLFRQ